MERASPTGDGLSAALERFLGRAAGAPVHAGGLRLLAGGASQEAWALRLEVEGGAYAGSHELVLRRDMGGALSSSVLPRAQEFAALCAMYAAGVRVPRPYWFVPAEHLGGDGRSAFLMELLHGETIGRRVVSDPALAGARARLPAQIAAALAAIHAVDPATPALGFLRAPAPTQSAASAALERMEADLRAVDEPHPALELALRWLRARDPGPGEVVVVHGDFRVGNLVVGPEGLRGVLDWENVHLGDPHSDLAWVCVRAWRFGQDALPAGGLCDRAAFFAAYTRASGRAVEPARAAYWEVLGNVRWALGALGQARRHLTGLEPSIELASLGRIAAEMELEALSLIEAAERGGVVHAG